MRPPPKILPSPSEIKKWEPLEATAPGERSPCWTRSGAKRAPAPQAEPSALWKRITYTALDLHTLAGSQTAREETQPGGIRSAGGSGRVTEAQHVRH